MLFDVQQTGSETQCVKSGKGPKEGGGKGGERGGEKKGHFEGGEGRRVTNAQLGGYRTVKGDGRSNTSQKKKAPGGLV